MPLDHDLEGYTLQPKKLKLSQYVKANVEKELEAKFTDFFGLAFKEHQGSDIDMDQAEAITLDLMQLNEHMRR